MWKARIARFLAPSGNASANGRAKANQIVDGTPPPGVVASVASAGADCSSAAQSATQSPAGGSRSGYMMVDPRPLATSPCLGNDANTAQQQPPDAADPWAASERVPGGYRSRSHSNEWPSTASVPINLSDAPNAAADGGREPARPPTLFGEPPSPSGDGPGHAPLRNNLGGENLISCSPASIPPRIRLGGERASKERAERPGGV